MWLWFPRTATRTPRVGLPPFVGLRRAWIREIGVGAVEVQAITGYAFDYAAPRVPTSASKCVSLYRPNTSWLAGLFRCQCVKNAATGSVSVGKEV